MLSEYYNIYRERANLIPNWEELDKNDLCNLYIYEEDEVIKDCYMAAIICRYWTALNSSYQQSYMAADEEDVYDWYIGAIMYALNHHRWTDEKSKLYNDPNGPDKCINISIKSARLTYFQQNNRFNRKINHGTESLNHLQEELGDSLSPSTTDEWCDNSSYYKWVKQEYDNYNDLNALVIDLILSSDVFTLGKNKAFDIQTLIKQIKSIDDRYYHYFANSYNYKFEDVKRRLIIYRDTPKKKLLEAIEFFFSTLSRKE